MAATITKSIGTSSRDYSTLQAWEDAIPANLVTADEVWKGECYNDSEFVFTGEAVYALNISDRTTDATRYVHLTAAAGQSFRDHASIQSNALKYDASKGVGIRNTGEFSGGITNASDYFRMDRLQVRFNATTNGVAVDCDENGNSSNCLIENCIITSSRAGSSVMTFARGTIRNCAIISNTAHANGALRVIFGSSVAIYNCSIVKPSDLSVGSEVGIRPAYETGCIVQNTAIFGFSAPVNGTFSSSGGYNATDISSGLPGSTGNVHSATYTSAFEGTTNAAQDFRAKAGGALLDVATTDTTNGATDIAGTARPGGSAYDIGCWELVESSSPQTISLGQVTESESSRALTVTAALTTALGRVSESEEARALTPTLANAITPGRVTETEEARALSVALEIGRVSETEAARALTVVPAFAATQGRVTETEAARAFTVAAALHTAIGRASETEEARGVTAALANTIALGRIVETEEARALVSPQVVAIGRASESEEARGVEIYVPSPPTTPPTPPPASSSGGIVSGGGPLQRISVSRNVTFKRAIAEALSEIRRDIKRKRRKLKHVEESAIDFEKEMANATLEYFTQGIFVPLETFHKNVMSEIVLNAQIEHDEEESELEILLMSLV